MTKGPLLKGNAELQVETCISGGFFHHLFVRIKREKKKGKPFRNPPLEGGKKGFEGPMLLVKGRKRSGTPGEK